MTLKIGVIGTGAIGKEHINRITNKLSGASIVAVTDVDAAQAQQAASIANVNARVHSTGQQVIDDADVDAVIVTSWGPTHEEYVLAAIAAGKPVFCEKPLATTAEGCRRIVEAEMAHGKKLVQVGFMRRYDQGYRALKEVVDSGNLGAPLIINCAHRNAAFPSFTADMAIIDSFVHEIDILRWLLQDEYISAQVVLPRSSSLVARDLQDPHIILLETRAGVRISTEVFINCQYGYDIYCQVVSEKGIAYLPEPASVTTRSNAVTATPILQDWKLRFTQAFDSELQAWINATQRGEVDGPTAWDGYVVSLTSDACVQAKHEKRIVPIDIPAKPAFYA